VGEKPEGGKICKEKQKATQTSGRITEVTGSYLKNQENQRKSEEKTARRRR